MIKSQDPGFGTSWTTYIQKNCLPSASLCDAAWSFERVMDYELDTKVIQISRSKFVAHHSVLRSTKGARLDPDRSAWSSV